MAGISVPQYEIFKIGTNKLKYSNWDLQITKEDAFKYQELISLFEAQRIYFLTMLLLFLIFLMLIYMNCFVLNIEKGRMSMGKMFYNLICEELCITGGKVIYIDKGVDEKVNDLALLIKKALISKNMYEKLCNEYKSKIAVLDEKIAEMDSIKAGYINKLNKFFKSLFRIFK